MNIAAGILTIENSWHFNRMTFKEEGINNLSFSSNQLRPIRAKFLDYTALYSLTITGMQTWFPDLIKHNKQSVSDSLRQVYYRLHKKAL